MKYLRLFESNSVIEDVKDICLELEDSGFTTFIGDERNTPENISRYTDLNKYVTLVFFYTQLNNLFLILY